ncbi:MAG: aminoacyl-tRNA hydrolase [Culicoidibacterales bacterium]
MKVLIGLGNPTKEYENTRHNIGFKIIDEILLSLGIKTMKEKFESQYELVMIKSEKYLFVKPLTYMNNSGRSAIKWIEYYDIEQEDIFVFHDELDIPFADLRLKTGGSAGGHNGLKSLISHLGTQEFNRIRLGIGRPSRGSVVDYVLGQFSKSETLALENELCPQVLTLFDQMQEQTFIKLMNHHNQKNK